jgi:hypothetical protein
MTPETSHYRLETREQRANKEKQPMPTIKETILELVDREAERRFNYGLGQSNPGYSIAEARAELWQSPTGKVLDELQRSAVADMTYDDARDQILMDKTADTAAFAGAFEALERGFPKLSYVGRP